MTRAIALKGELRVIQLGDRTIDAYFQKIESIVILLNALGLWHYQFIDIFNKGLPSALFYEFRDDLSVRFTFAPTTRDCLDLY